MAMAIVTNLLIAWIAPRARDVEKGKVEKEEGAMGAEREEYSSPAIERVDRVVYVDPLGVWTYTIDINRERALPQPHAVAELEAALSAREAEVLLTDPWAGLLLAPERPEPTEPAQPPQASEPTAEPDPATPRGYCSRAYKAIQPLLEHDIEALLDPRRRGKLVADRATAVGCTKRSLYNWLSRYWQRGMVPAALLPRFAQRGGPGIQRIKDETSSRSRSTSRRGRPPKNGRTGAAQMTTERLQRLEHELTRALKLHPGKEPSYLFKRITEECYHVGIEVRGDQLTYVLAPQSERPSERQFYYWYHKLFGVEARARRRYGDQRFEQSHRAVLGDSTGMAFSPNALVQIDAFDSGVYLVDGFSRRHILGKAIVYVVIDTFSRLITGVSVRLRGPDWEGAMLALFNSTQDKVAFCQHYGVSIDEQQWPCHHVCHRILADRGELKGTNADHLPVAVGIEMENTAPYRPDLKAIVERHIGLIKQRRLRHLDGNVDDARQRRDPNPLRDACLTPYEFTTILIRVVLHHNNWEPLTTYAMTPAMFVDGVRPYPLDLWQWGVSQRHGCLRTLPRQVLWHNLLPSEEATVNDRGIWFKRFRYDCERAHREGWYVKARQPKRRGGGSWRVRAAYLPNRPGEIYLRIQEPDKSFTYEPCSLHASMASFAAYDWSDLDTAVEDRRADNRDTLEARQQAEADLHAHVDQILTDARAATAAATAGMSHAERERDRRYHRREEQTTADPTGTWPAPAPAPALSRGPSSTTMTGAHVRRRPTRQAAPDASAPGYVPAPTYSDILSDLLAENASASTRSTPSAGPTREGEERNERS